jgi:hypothetical protein
MLKNKILVHALVFLPLREIDPSIDEKRIISGGTVYKDSNRTTLGRYPVMTLTQNDLHRKVIRAGTKLICKPEIYLNKELLNLRLQCTFQVWEHPLKLLQLHHALNKRDGDDEDKHEEDTSRECRYFPEPDLSIGDPEVRPVHVAWLRGQIGHP